MTLATRIYVLSSGLTTASDALKVSGSALQVHNGLSCWFFELQGLTPRAIGFPKVVELKVLRETFMNSEYCFVLDTFSGIEHH